MAFLLCLLPIQHRRRVREVPSSAGCPGDDRLKREDRAVPLGLSPRLQHQTQHDERRRRERQHDDGGPGSGASAARRRPASAPHPPAATASPESAWRHAHSSLLFPSRALTEPCWGLHSWVSTSRRRNLMSRSGCCRGDALGAEHNAGWTGSHGRWGQPVSRMMAWLGSSRNWSVGPPASMADSLLSTGRPGTDSCTEAGVAARLAHTWNRPRR